MHAKMELMRDIQYYYYTKSWLTVYNIKLEKQYIHSATHPSRDKWESRSGNTGAISEIPLAEGLEKLQIWWRFTVYLHTEFDFQ